MMAGSNTDSGKIAAFLPRECMEFARKKHELKCLPQYFDAVAWQGKRFELRKDDRGYKVGDLVILREWDGENYTGRQLSSQAIRYILRDCPEFGLMDGYCILGF